MTCEKCCGSFGKRCDYCFNCDDGCFSIILIGLQTPYYLCKNGSKKGRTIGIINGISMAMPIFIIISYFLLIFNSFWIAAIASQSGMCNLIIFKNAIACNYWSMLLEIFLWITIFSFIPFVVCCSISCIVTMLLSYYSIVGIAVTAANSRD